LKLRAIADALGAVRDEDVALIALEDLKSKAKGPAAEGIEMLASERRKRRKQARRSLKTAIEDSAIEDFRKEFQSKLRQLRVGHSKKPNVTGGEDPALSFRELDREVIRDRVKEFRDTSPHLYFPFRTKELHELRILAKRLRYAVELSASCWDRELGEMAKEIALLQTSLGELHDCDVWIESLGARLKKIARMAKSEPGVTQMQAGASWLLEFFVNARSHHYRDALVRWQEWEANGLLVKLTSVIEDS
jgi:CHAD domain-containing protein